MAVTQRFTIEHPNRELAWEIDRDEAETLYQELGEALGYNGSGTAPIEIQTQGANLDSLAQVLRAYMPSPHAVSTPAVLPPSDDATDRLLSPEEALAAQQAMAQVQPHQQHLADPSQPRGSAIGTRHVPRT